jgi:hypothetical protein
MKTLNLRLKARWRKYLADRKLAKSGYSSWRVYRHNRDSDVCRYAHKTSDFYQNYKYVFRCSGGPAAHYAYNIARDYGPAGLVFGYEIMRDWCETKCRFKYRVDIHRVLKQTGIGLDGSTDEDWYFNDLGGSDLVFFAFMNEQDYIHFMLRWG